MATVARATLLKNKSGDGLLPLTKTDYVVADDGDTLTTIISDIYSAIDATAADMLAKYNSFQLMSAADITTAVNTVFNESIFN